MSIFAETEAMLVALAALAHADSITLDTGATITGDLARYEFGGDCQISVTEGEFAGVIVIVPCHRVESFVRTSIRTPVPIGLQEEVAKKARLEAPFAEEAPAVAAVAAVAPRPVEEPVVVAAEEPIEEEAVAGAPIVEPTPTPGAYTEPRPYDEPIFPTSATEPIVPVAPEPPVAARPQQAPMMDFIDGAPADEAEPEAAPVEEASEASAEGGVHHAVRF